MQVFLSYPIWFILFCLAVAITYTIVLYYKQNSHIDKKYIYLFNTVRFLSVFIISFLLLAPFIKRHFSKIEKPLIILLQDNSASINYAFKTIDSNTYNKKINALFSDLSNDFEVKQYYFDDGVNNSFNKKYAGVSSNISKALEDIHDLYFNRNIGSIIIATDGIYNRGISPLNTSASNAFPIYSILIGDTSKQKDAKIQNCLYNEIVYLGDKFEIKTEISAYNCKNSNAIISIEEIGIKGSIKTLATNSINYIEQNEQKTISFIINASKSGLNHYRISHSKITGEFTYENNVKDLYIQVLDGRDKILLLAAGPHPDISALKQAIEKNKNYTLDIKFPTDNIGKIEDYNLVILHQIPGLNQNLVSIINEIKQKNISVWYILGTNSNLSEISKQIGIIEFSKIRNLYNDVHAERNKDFNLFTIEEKHFESIEKLPPLSAPFGDYKSNKTNVLLSQKVGNISSNYPLLTMGEFLQQKQAVLMGEGIWRWRIYNYLQNQNFDAVDDLIQKTIQYLSIKGDKRKFKTILPKVIFSENENVTINAQLYNDNYQLINNCDVMLSLYDENNINYKYTFSKNNTTYSLDFGKLKSGNYRYEASTSCNGKNYKDEGEFSIKAIQLESINITSDDDLLYALSKKNNAKMVFASEIEQLSKLIKAKKDIKPIIYESYKTESIIQLPILFFLILFLLSFEWILRKYLGLY